VKAHPEISGESAQGRFGTLHGWLRDHLYRHGRKFEPAEITERATGAPMNLAPYLAYLRAKYGQLYRLPTAA
jgi:carboxypeptidase Taq